MVEYKVIKHHFITMPPKKPISTKEFKTPTKIGKLPIQVQPVVSPESVTSQFKFTPKKVTEPASAGSFAQSKVLAKPTEAFTPAINSVLKSQPLNLSKTNAVGGSKAAKQAMVKDSDFARFVRDIKGGTQALVGDELTTTEKAKAIGSAPINLVAGIGSSVLDFATIVLPKALTTGVKMVADNIENNTPASVDQLNRTQRERFERGTKEEQDRFLADMQSKRDATNRLANKVSGWATEVIKDFNKKQVASLEAQGITENTSIASPRKLGYGMGSGLASIAAYVGLTALTKSPAVASASLGWVEGSETYVKAVNQYQSEGMAKDEAEQKAGALAMTEAAGIAVLEKIGMDALFRSYAGGVSRNAAIGAITETLQESTQTVWSNLVAKYGYDKTQSLYDGLFETMITTLPVGAFGGAFSRTTDPVINIDAGATNKEDFEEKEVQDAVTELYKAVNDQVNEFADTVLDPEKPDVNQALYEDINAEVELKGKKAVIEQLSAEGPFEVTTEEATKLVEEAQKTISDTATVPPDIFADIEAAAAIVSGKPAPSTTPKTEEAQTTEEDNFFDNLPEAYQDQAEEAWQDTYAEEYDVLEKKLVTLEREYKTAKSKEKKALVNQMEEIAAKQAKIEQTFIEQQRAIIEAERKAKIDKAVEEVEESVTPKDGVDRTTLPKSLQNDLNRYEQLDRTNEDINTDDLLARIKSSLSSRGMKFVWEGNYPNRQIVVRKTAIGLSQMTVEELHAERASLLNKSLNTRLTKEESTRLSMIVANIKNKTGVDVTVGDGTIVGNEKLRNPDTRGGVRQTADTESNVDGGGKSGERRSSDTVDSQSLARGERDSGRGGAGERPGDDVSKDKTSIRQSAKILEIDSKKAQNKAFDALDEFGFIEAYPGQYGGASADKYYISVKDGNDVYHRYIETFASFQDAMDRIAEIKDFYSKVNNKEFNTKTEIDIGSEKRDSGRGGAGERPGDDVTREEAEAEIDGYRKDIELGTENVVYTPSGIVSTTRTTTIAEKQETAIGKVIVDIIKSKGQQLSDESLFMVVQVPGFMPLNIERLPTNELAVSHTFEQNGDLMRDPEVVFLIDNKGQLKASTIQTDGISSGARPIKPNDSFLSMWAKNLKAQGFVGTKQKPLDPGQVNREAIKKLENDLRSIYIGAGDTEFEGLTKADQILSEIMTSLELAEAGYKVILDGNFDHAVPSTFPDWIPEASRNRDDLNTLMQMFKDIRGISYPNKPTETKRREFADAFFDQMDMQLGVDTRALRDNILNLYDKDTITGGSQELSKVGQNSAPRDTEGEVRTAEGYSNEEIESLIKDSAYLTSSNFVELTNGRQPWSKQMKVINAWQPAGGREAEGADGRGLLDEYYTPAEVVNMVKTMLTKAGAFSKASVDVLEPSVGVGNFLYSLPENAKVTGYEINEVSARIAKLNHPSATIKVQPLEEIFIDGRGNKKEVHESYDVVVGNPPYGGHRGKYKGLGEEAKISRYETYFMKRSLDLTREGGYVAMVVPSSFLRSSTNEAGKAQMAASGVLVDAVRLPNGTFSTTDIGTDILVFKKETTTSANLIEERLATMSADAYFERSPDKVLGEKAQKNGRYGLENVVKGDIETAENAFATQYEAEGLVQEVEITETASVDEALDASAERLSELANTETTPKVLRETAQREEDRRTEEMIMTDQEVQKEMMTNLGLKVGDEVQRFNEGVIEKGTLQKVDGTPVVQVVTEAGTPTPLNENWYKQDEVASLTSAETLDLATLSGSDIEDGQWNYVTATGQLEGDFDPSKAFYLGGYYYNEFNYAQGNVYEKLNQLEKDRKTIGEEQYKKQKAVLEAIIPPRMTVDRMRIPPHAHFTEMVKFEVEVEGKKAPKSLQSSFITWLNTLPLSAFGESSRRSVVQYVQGEAVRGGDKLQNEEDRRNRRIEGDKLFSVFLTEELTPEQKTLVEDTFNELYNAYAKPDYSKVPLVSKISATYKNKPLEIRDIQRQGIGFLLNKGVGLLAHDVGLGKTMQGIIANIELINRGWAKKPLVVLPSASVYAQWVKDFQALAPDIKLNELSNLGKDFSGDLATLAIPNGTISVITEEGFKKLGFSDETYSELTKDMLDVIENPNDNKKTKRAKELKTAKAEETVGTAMRGTSTERTFEDLGFDAITVDEIHNYNHIIGSAKAADDKATEYRGFSQVPSISGLKLWLAAQYIMKNNAGRNVIGLSATPFTNHPLEYYSILSLFARDRMTQMGIRNVNDFMSLYMDVVAKDEVRADGMVASKMDVRGFNNAQQFQSLLREFIDFRDGEEAGIIRPQRLSREYIVKENRMSYDFKQMAQELFSIKEAGTLRAMTELQKIAFSPYASQYYQGPVPTAKQFVENSPKIKLAIELLAETYTTVKDSNHLIYSNRGKEYLPLIKQYLVEQKGIPAAQIEIITGDTAKAKRTIIQNDFNAGKIRVVLGNEAIEEGINLQEKTTDLYMLSQPWNFTAVRQVIGRAWRQGNKWRNVRINTFFSENTFDIFLSQAIEKKRVRYQKSLEQGTDYVDSGDINYEEMKFDLMTDPVLRTRQEYAEKRQRMEREVRRIKADFATKNRRAKEYVDAVSKVNEYKDYLFAYPDATWVKRSLQDAETKLVSVRRDLNDRGIDVTSIDKDLEATQAKIAELETTIKNFTEEENNAIEAAKIEAELLVDTTGTEDYARHVRDRKEDNSKVFLENDPMFSLRNAGELMQDEVNIAKLNKVSFDEFFKSKTDPLYEFKKGTGIEDEFIARGTVEEAIEELGGLENVERGTLPIANLETTEEVNMNSERAKKVVDAVAEGERTPIVIDEYGRILDGHHRFKAYQALGLTNVPVVGPKGTGIDVYSKSELKALWNGDISFSAITQPRDVNGRYTTLAERRAEARRQGFVPDTDLRRVANAKKKLTGKETAEELAKKKEDRIYTLRMKASNFEDAKAQLERYQKRFGLKFDVEFADRIFVKGSKVRDKILAETEAYAVYYNRAITLTPEMVKTTADHEFIHFVVDNLDKIKAFSGFTKESLYQAANNGYKIKGMNATELRTLEEKIAVGYERYLIEKAMDKVAREKKYGKVLASFYETLKNTMMDFYRNLGGSFGELADFYDTVARGREKNETTVVFMQNPVRKAQVAYQTKEGLKYLDFEELSLTNREVQTAARAAYFSEVESIKDNDLMTNKVFRNKNQLNWVMKDLNTLEDMTAQARDIYLKDPEQFEQARTIELIGEEHDADKHRLDEHFADELAPYMKLTEKERAKVNEILWQGDEMGKEFEPVELLHMNINDNQIAAYNAVRKSLNMAHEMLLTEMARKGVNEEEIDTFRQERVGYMPHKWVPRYSKTQKLKSLVTGKDVYVVKHQRKVEGEPKHETYHMDAFASEKEALEAQKYLMENTPNWEESQVRFAVDKLNSLEVDFFASQELTSERMIAVIEQMRTDGFVKDDVVELLKSNLLSMFKEKGFGRHYLRRTGVRGYDTENTELVLADYFSGFSGYVTKMRWSTEYFVALSQVDARRQQRYYAWLRDLVAYKLNNNPEWRMARTIAFTWYLANDLSYLLTNTTQNVIVGTGELSKLVEGKDKAWKPEAYLVKALKDWTTKNITVDEKSAIDGLLEKGQLGAEMTAELMGFKNNPLYREISTMFSKALFNSTAIVERNVNRIPAFLAARRIFKEQGYSDVIANQKALEVSNDIHFRYGRIDRPRMLRGRVNVLFIFQNYIRTFLYQMYRDVSRREYVALTRKLGYTFLLGGVTALPFGKLIWEAIRAIADDEDDEELKEELSRWDILLQKGIPATFDLDLSGRVGIELLSVTNIAENPTDVRTYLGSIGDLLFKRPFETWDLFAQGRTTDALAKMLPDMLANPIRAYNGHVYGVRSFAGVPLVDENGDVYKYNTWETILKAAGYTPTQEALLWEEKSREWDANAKLQEERTEISRTIRGMVQRGEFVEARQLQDDAKERGLIAERTDYIRQFASDDWFKEAVTAWEGSDKSREQLSKIEDELIEKVYGGVATDDQRNNARKELAVYRQFGINNPHINDIMKAGTNDEKVKVLLEIKDNIGEEAFDDLIRKGRTGMYTEKGSRVPILFSDELMKKLRDAEKINDNQN